MVLDSNVSILHVKCWTVNVNMKIVEQNWCQALRSQGAFHIRTLLFESL